MNNSGNFPFFINNNNLPLNSYYDFKFSSNFDSSHFNFNDYKINTNINTNNIIFSYDYITMNKESTNFTNNVLKINNNLIKESVENLLKNKNDKEKEIINIKKNIEDNQKVLEKIINNKKYVKNTNYYDYKNKKIYI
jgi:hypothetical protein